MTDQNIAVFNRAKIAGSNLKASSYDKILVLIPSCTLSLQQLLKSQKKGNMNISVARFDEFFKNNNSKMGLVQNT
ncbi:hypothetical protein ACFLQ1_01460 [Candidatus Auribacterota bacterium]